MAKTRRQICTQLVKLQLQVDPKLGKIEGLKDELRKIIAKDGQGFTEEIDGKGSVQGKPGAKKEFKGTIPSFDAAAFLALPETERKPLYKANIVTDVQVWSSESKPSITVRV